MAYYSGSANDMAAVRSALVAACVAEGWAWNSSTEMLSKEGVFVRLQIVNGYLTLLGRTSVISGDAPNVVRIGALPSKEVNYPLIYEAFVFDDEFFMVINYSIDYYQFCAFGRSAVTDLPGSGMWIAATLSHTDPVHGIAISPSNGGYPGLQCVAPALFWATISGGGTNGAIRNCWVHSDFDGQAWLPAQSLDGASVGITASTPLIGMLPNAWNSEAVLVPIRGFKVRPSNKNSLTLDLRNARHTRNDNYTPGQIIAVGDERWKVFPWYRKNTLYRNGGDAIDHTGTLAWALRYEGP